MATTTTTDPLLCETTKRFVPFPIEHDDLWQLYKEAQASYWTAEEIDLSDDKFGELSKDEQHFVKHVLAFFAASDGIVQENLAFSVDSFMGRVQAAEARAFYSFQVAIEQVHAETYGLLLQTYVRDAEERNKLFGALESMPCIRRKYEWARKFMADERDFATRLVAWACVEGIFFSGAFCAIFWLKKRGLMPGLTFSNELISRDEGLHCRFAVALHNKLQQKCNRGRVHEIVRQAVAVELSFVKEALPVRLIGMNADMMEEYVKFVADRLSRDLESGAIFEASNPFDWMELISLQGKTNFFEKRVSDYALSSVVAGGEGAFTTDEDF
jgi:ribonucleoside-diphosphate reductase beta chain